MNLLKKVWKGFDYLPKDIRGFTTAVLPFLDSRGVSTPSGAAIRRAYNDGKRWCKGLDIVYEGPWASLPAADTFYPGAFAIIEAHVPDTTGWTRAPTQTRGRATLWWVRHDIPGTTLAWKPVGTQSIYEAVGNGGNLWVPSYTLPGATGVHADFFEIPAGMLNTPGLTFLPDGIIGRGATAAGTVNVSVGINSVAVAVLTGLAANTSSTGWIFGKMVSRAAASQVQTYTIGIQGKANISGANLSPTHALGSAARVSLLYDTATTNDTLTGLQMSLLVRG